MTEAARRLLLDLWTAGIAAVDGRPAVRRYLERARLQGRWRIIAIGKAAAAMTLGAHDALGEQILDALVVTKTGHVPEQLAASLERLDLHIASHPMPDQRSLAAGAALLERVVATSAGDGLLFLISGGASSLAEVPAAGVTLAELVACNEWLLASGLPIGEVNAVRGRLSQIKGGRLAAHLVGRKAVALLISDVPDDDPAVIGSGMLVAARPAALPESLPAAWRERLEALPDSRATAGGQVEIAIVARPEDLLAALRDAARARAQSIEVWPERFAGDAHDIALRAARDLHGSSADLIAAAGESTVHLPAAPGRGGRNQHLALVAAQALAGGPEVTLLAAGTDGTDGPTDDAGAIVDAETLERGALAGLDARAALARAAAGEFLEASGDLLCTGPTGTNVGDVLIGLTAAGQHRLMRGSAMGCLRP